jgi:hypothetical protein
MYQRYVVNTGGCKKPPGAGVAHGWRTWASADFDPDHSAIGAETAGPKHAQSRLTELLVN